MLTRLQVLICSKRLSTLTPLSLRCERQGVNSTVSQVTLPFLSPPLIFFGLFSATYLCPESETKIGSGLRYLPPLSRTLWVWASSRATGGRNYGAALISSLLLPRAIASAKLRLCETALPRSLARRSIKNKRASWGRSLVLRPPSIHSGRYLRPLIISTRKRVQSRINPRSAAAETSNSIRSRAFPFKSLLFAATSG